MITSSSQSSYRPPLPIILGVDGLVIDYATAITLMRNKAGLTTQQLGDAIGMSDKMIESWEAGELPYSVALTAIASIVSTGLLTENYHGEETMFYVGKNVIHAADDGLLYAGTIIAIDDMTLEIGFDDGERGHELPSSCF